MTNSLFLPNHHAPLSIKTLCVVCFGNAVRFGTPFSWDMKPRHWALRFRHLEDHNAIFTRTEVSNVEGTLFVQNFGNRLPSDVFANVSFQHRRTKHCSAVLDNIIKYLKRLKPEA
jgi:hypothetical protein